MKTSLGPDQTGAQLHDNATAILSTCPAQVAGPTQRPDTGVPSADRPLPRTIGAPHEVLAQLMDNKPILLVEDNPDDEALTLRALKKNHISNQIVVARDGAEAIDWLCGIGSHAGRDTGIQPAVVLLDLKLPKLDGLEVLKRIRSEPRTALLPVVILTSSREDQDLVRGYSLGANSYVRKPVDFNQFIEAVRQLGMYWLLLNEAPPGPGG